METIFEKYRCDLFFEAIFPSYPWHKMGYHMDMSYQTDTNPDKDSPLPEIICVKLVTTNDELKEVLLSFSEDINTYRDKMELRYDGFDDRKNARVCVKPEYKQQYNEFVKKNGEIISTFEQFNEKFLKLLSEYRGVVTTVPDKCVENVLIPNLSSNKDDDMWYVTGNAYIIELYMESSTKIYQYLLEKGILNKLWKNHLDLNRNYSVYGDNPDLEHGLIQLPK